MERFFVLDKYNTWTDWDLILTAKTVTPPEPKTNYVNIDGMSGTLDLSESLTGGVTYNDRTVSASFWTDKGSRDDREKLFREIVRVLHGKKIQIVEPDDPDHYFYGRIVVNSSNNTLSYLEFSIEAICEPWRYAINDGVRRINVNGSTITDVVIYNNGVRTLTPTITVTGSVTLTYAEKSVSLTAGTYKVSDLKLHQGGNNIGISGSGSVTFTYKEADL